MRIIYAGGGYGPLGVQNAITKLELNVGLLRVRDAPSAYIWEVKEYCPM